MKTLATLEEISLDTGAKPVVLHRFQRFQHAYGRGYIVAREVPTGMIVFDDDWSLTLYEPGEMSPVGPCNDARMTDLTIYPAAGVMERIRPFLR